jgi:hypothetical protein
MARRAVLVLAAALAVLAGCGGEETARLPPACTDADAVMHALASAPRAVRLADGTRLSDCVRRAQRDGDQQAVGLAFTAVADALGHELAASDTAALRLGYLVGAARAGADDTHGLHEELLFRLGQVAGVGGPPTDRRAAYEHGRAAGRRDG